MENLLKLGRVTAVTGRLGSGRTLSVVALLKKLQESGNNTGIVTNVKLNGIGYKELRLENLFDYKDSLIFYDMFEFFSIGAETRVAGKTEEASMIKDNFIGFLDNLEENNSWFVFTIQSLRYLDPDINNYVDVILNIHKYDKLNDYVSMSIIALKSINCFPFMCFEKALVRLNKVSQYFNLYGTIETIKPRAR